MAAIAFCACGAVDPRPPSGLLMRIDASPQVATPQDGSSEITSVKVFSAATYQKECSIATARVSFACTSGAQEFSNLTVPRRPYSFAGSSWANAMGARAAQMKERASREVGLMDISGKTKCGA